MHFLDTALAKAKIADLGFDWEVIEEAMGPFFKAANCQTKHTRDDFRNSFIAAKEAVAFFGDFTNATLYIHSMGGRLDLENRHLFDRLRSSYGERRPNHPAPACVFEAYDIFDLTTFCDVAINGAFRAVLIQHCSRNWVAFTEDEEMHLIIAASHSPRPSRKARN